MADDGSAKRLKTALEDGNVAADSRRRIIQLESEVQRLRSENEQLRQCLQLKGNHEALPVSLAPSVDLSRVDTSIVAHITAYLGESRELINLALTCKSFGWRQPTSTLNLSLVEEVARQIVCSRATDLELSCLPPYAGGTTTWLSILNRFDQLLVFDVLLGDYIGHKDGDPTTVCGTMSRYNDDGTWNENEEMKCIAVASGYVMTSGIHYAEFNVDGWAYMGIVRPLPGLDAGRYLQREDDFDFIWSTGLHCEFLAHRSDDWGGSNVHACELDFSLGDVRWTDWDKNYGRSLDAEDYPESSSANHGTIRIVLNLDEGIMTASFGSDTLLKDGLSGPYCWYASVETGFRSDVVSIKRVIPPRCRCG